MGHIPSLIHDLAFILALAGLATVLCRWLKQPVVLGYVIAGLLIGPHTPFVPLVSDIPTIQIWAEIGVIFLLFGLGLEFSFKKLTAVGSSAVITGLLEVSTMITLGYFTGQALGWSNTDSLFLGGILAISSTTIIIRAVEELGIKSRKSVSLVFGILIIEDLVAVLLLVLLSTVAISQNFEGTALIGATAKLGFFLVLCFVGGIFLVPTFMRKAQKFLNNETLLIMSLGLCLSMVLASNAAGFSPALGAFLMGSILSETSQAHKIIKGLDPVKSLFSAVFFVSVGMLIDPAILQDHALAILIITLVLVFGKTIAASTGALLSGQTMKTSLQTGFTLGQIGEFSFIIAGLGATLNVTSSFLYPIAVAVSALTTLLTPYSIKCSDPVFEFFDRKLPNSWRESLLRYSSNAQSAEDTAEWKVIMLQAFSRVIISSSLLIALYSLGDHYIMPFIYEQLGSELPGRIMLITAMLTLASPFLWALAQGGQREKPLHGLVKQVRSLSPLVLIRIVRLGLTLAFVAAFVLKFGSFKFGLGAIIVLGSLALIFSWGKVASIYNWFEGRFLENLNEQEILEMERKAKLPVVAPWDAHISYFSIAAESPVVGSSLIEARVRERFGVTVASIQRGVRKMMAPSPHLPIFPGDKLGVIGDDKELQEFAKYVESSVVISEESNKEDNSKLMCVHFQEGCPYIGTSIREARLREATHGLVVGIERETERILNPTSEIKFAEGDLVWIVGDEEKINSLDTGAAPETV